MAHEIKGRKTEHAGAKRGCGAYWGKKVIAKHASNKERRVNDRAAVAIGEREADDDRWNRDWLFGDDEDDG